VASETQSANSALAFRPELDGAPSSSASAGRSRPARLLIVEDEPRIADLLVRAFAAEGYTSEVVGDGRLALRAATRFAPDAILLDLMLPGKHGLAVLPELCDQVPDIPVIVLSARRESSIRVASLRSGAVDFVSKPFSFDELLERLRLRLRLAQAPRAASEVVVSSGVRLDTRRREAAIAGTTHPLTNREFRLLEYLMRHPGEVVSRERLTSEVWGYAFVSDTNIVDATVRRLRNKIGRARIVTVRGTGYVFGS
jgi:two-component system copper resistance phosphate regulon response regulator CusR